QVVGNLVDNAVKYGGAGGTIRVAVEEEGDRVLVRVIDQGPGIPAELRTKLFEPFVQGPRPQDRKESGLGIGLTIARELVELQGGDLVALPGPGGIGAEMRVSFPRLEGSAAPE